MHLVETDELQSRAPQASHQPSEKLRGHFEQAVWLETVRSRRPNMVQREDCSHSADEGPGYNIGAGEIQTLHPAADDRLPNGHFIPFGVCGNFWRRIT